MSERSIRRLALALSGLAVALGFNLASDRPAKAVSAAIAASTGNKLVYRIMHPSYGNIGTYTNLIEKTGNTTTVTTSGQIKVVVMGIVAYKQDISRVERWLGDRLVAFHSITTVNGRPFEVNGAAEGDHFKVTTPTASVTAPESIKVANLWSDHVLKGDTILAPDTGEVETVKVGAGMDTALASADGQTVAATQFKINCNDNHTRYDVWIGQGGTPLMFDVVTPDSKITFRLVAVA